MKSTEAPKDNGGGGYGVFFFFCVAAFAQST